MWGFRVILFLSSLSFALSRLNTLSPLPSNSFNNEFYDGDYQTQDYYPPKKIAKSFNWRSMGLSSLQMMSYGSLLFVAFSFARKLILPQLIDKVSPSQIYVPLKEGGIQHNDTITDAVIEVKGEIGEIWNAILNIHNKQNDFRDKISNLDTKLDTKVSSWDDSQLDHLEDDLSNVKKSFDKLKKSISSIESTTASQQQQFQQLLQQVEKVSAINSNVALLTSRMEAIEKRSVELEESLTKRMKAFYQTCKDMILNVIETRSKE